MTKAELRNTPKVILKKDGESFVIQIGKGKKKILYYVSWDKIRWDNYQREADLRAHSFKTHK